MIFGSDLEIVSRFFNLFLLFFFFFGVFSVSSGILSIETDCESGDFLWNEPATASASSEASEIERLLVHGYLELVNVQGTSTELCIYSYDSLSSQWAD